METFLPIREVAAKTGVDPWFPEELLTPGPAAKAAD